MTIKQCLVQGFCYFLQVVLACNPSICIRWKVTWTVFTLTCQISNLTYQVTIKDQHGKSVSTCVPPYPSDECTSLIQGGMVEQRFSDEIIFSLEKTADKEWNINGNWTCLHAHSLDTEYVEVTILGKKDLEHKGINECGFNSTSRICHNDGIKSNDQNLECPINFTVYGIVGYGLGFLIAVCVKIRFCKTVHANKLLDCCKDHIPVNVKMVFIVVSTVILLLLICLVAYYTVDEDSCRSYYYMIFTGMIIGFASGFLFTSIKNCNDRGLNPDRKEEFELEERNYNADEESLNPNGSG